MKIRNGFVSNSSSSSFVIKLEDLTLKQAKKIRSHVHVAKKMPHRFFNDWWSILENDEYIMGETYMDNFDMDLFLTEIGVDPKVVTWGDMGQFSLEETDDED